MAKLTAHAIGTLARYIAEAIDKNPNPPAGKDKDGAILDYQPGEAPDSIPMEPWEVVVKKSIDNCNILPDYSPAFESGEHSEFFDSLVHLIADHLHEEEREDEEGDHDTEDGDEHDG